MVPTANIILQMLCIALHWPLMCLQGWDKTYCLRFVEEEFSDIHFFGDKTFEVLRASCASVKFLKVVMMCTQVLSTEKI